MICNRGFHPARLCPRHSNFSESSWFPGAADEDKQLSPSSPPKKRKSSQDMVLGNKEPTFQAFRNSCVAKF